jgi:hypothetical protein
MPRRRRQLFDPIVLKSTDESVAPGIGVWKLSIRVPGPDFSIFSQQT